VLKQFTNGGIAYSRWNNTMESFYVSISVIIESLRGGLTDGPQSLLSLLRRRRRVQ
jgi:hypothetical protein